MAVDFEALSQYYKSLSLQRKVELYLILGLAIFGLVSCIIMLSTFQKTKQESSINSILIEQNNTLKRTNIEHIKTIESFANSIAKRNERDSINMAKVEKNTAISNDLSKQITQINQKYDKANFNLNATDADILEYLRSERLSTEN